MPRYLLEKEGDVEVCEERPTQDDLKDKGEGVYFLRRDDGSLSRKQTVRLNRNGNLTVHAETPVGLEGVSSLNLERMSKSYRTIVKVWPAKQVDADEIAAELSYRDEILQAAARTFATKFPRRTK